VELPLKEDSVIIHYGCSDFEKPEHIIFWVGAVYFNQGQKEYFFADGEEIEIIQELKGFVEEHKEKTFIHWSMNSAKFGFKRIERRHKELQGAVISIHPPLMFDLSEYLKEKYGVYYVPRDPSRLNYIARLNNFSGYKDNVEVKELNEASERLELLYSTCEAEREGKLKTLTSRDKVNPFPTLFTSYDIFEKFLEYTDEHILDAYIDYSYLKKRLEAEGLTHRMKDLEFIEFLYRDMKLSDSLYEDFIAKGKLIALKKSSSVQRENNFNNIFK
jgi:hypothetical protein